MDEKNHSDHNYAHRSQRIANTYFSHSKNTQVYCTGCNVVTGTTKVWAAIIAGLQNDTCNCNDS